MPSKAKFSQKTKKEIYERDWGLCILCNSNQSLVAHHVYYWINANRWPDRNNANQWVTLCGECHYKLHNWVNAVEQWKARDCLKYLDNL